MFAAANVNSGSAVFRKCIYSLMTRINRSSNVIKLTSYDTRRTIFAAKRKLKGTKLVITENLTKTRAQLLKKAREMDNVEHAWTIDGRIVCLLRSGRKETVVNESELSNLRRDD